ncbi:adenylate/guanylate cyclase domain-containing protein [Nitrobacter sp.]|uniref:adenylate/guanylate cyclase domain-containing protein n=1 Tax=Nitrobacter sp. TaxID=29420 RepID=UPI003F64B3CE
MSGGGDNTRYRRRGLFAKYVMSLVGLVVFVLAVNGALEIWISYNQTRTALVREMTERADTTAHRIEQSITDLERQVSWVTRASVVTVEQRRADYAELLNQVPAVSRIFQLDGQGHEQLRLSRLSVSFGSGADFSRDVRFTQAVAKGISYGPVFFREQQPFMSIAVAHAGRDAGASVAEIDLRFLSKYIDEAQAGKIGSAYVVDSNGILLAGSDKDMQPGKDLSALPQLAASLKSGNTSSVSGTNDEGNAVLTASSQVPKLRWFVLFEQPASQALAPIHDLLIRIGLLVAFGLVLAILAGMLLARRMLVPIQALNTGAQRLGGGDFEHRIDVRTGDELEQLAGRFNSMAGQLRETYSDLELKVRDRTRELAQSVSELKALEEFGRAVASSLDLNAVLRTVAGRAFAITKADAVLIYGFDAEARRFDLIEVSGMEKPADGDHGVISADDGLLGQAAATGQPIAIEDFATSEANPLKDAAAAGFRSALAVPLVDQQGVLGALIVLRRGTGAFSPDLLGLMQTFAHQSVLAMRNARLFHEVDQKGKELATAHGIVQQQADKLQQQTYQLLNWNKSLEEQVGKQLGEIERIRRLERFLAPQVAQLVASSDGQNSLLDSHRGEVTVVFCDLRGFTAFTESSEPEEAMNVLREYHAALGELIFKYEGTLDRYAGDGVMILFNAPIPVPDHTPRAVRMAVEMRDSIGVLSQKWRNRGHSLGFSVGIAVGYATLGQVGFERRLEYAAIGSVTNLASRLCDEAKAGQIVVNQRAYGMVENFVEATALAPLVLKGFHHPVAAVEIHRWQDRASGDFAPRAAAGRSV